MKALNEYHCFDCAFCRTGKRIAGYNRRTGKHELEDALLCALNPPATHYGNPETSAALICYLFTDTDGNQPLRHLGAKEVNA